MSIGFTVAIAATNFLDLLDREEESLAKNVLEASDSTAVFSALDGSRQRLARAVDLFVRGLPIVVRNDSNLSRQAAYALVGLADERMLHHPAGGLERWRERLLEYDLYGSAIAGQEIVMRAKESSSGLKWSSSHDDGGSISTEILAPLYLAVFRAGFEGSLRGEPSSIASLIAALEETIGRRHVPVVETPVELRPKRMGLSPLPLVLTGLAIWLGSGYAVWTLLASEPLEEIDRIATRLSQRLSVPLELNEDPFVHSLGPVTPLQDTTANANTTEADH